MCARTVQIVIATGNPHKVEELRCLLALPGFEFVGLGELPGGFSEPEETGPTFAENAAIKALSYAEQTGMPCLADDSGLEIDALAGAPGVISSHYCTDGRDVGMTRAARDAANNERVLRELGGVPPAERTARFVCVMALAGRALGNGGRPTAGVRGGLRPSVWASARGTFEGRIGLPGYVPRGSNGFGYDPLFLVAPEFTHTSAELAPPEKNQLSHRGRAAAEMLVQLHHLLTRD